jgi:hypothetical protein
MPKGKRGKTKKLTKGGYYSFNGALATGAADWAQKSEYGPFVAGRGGNDSAGTSKPVTYGRGRHRKTGSRKKKHHRRRRTMRGGNKYGAVAASYTGTGERGMANYVQTNTKYPPFGGAQGGAFNNAGAQPGSGYSSFNILPKTSL